MHLTDTTREEIARAEPIVEELRDLLAKFPVRCSDDIELDHLRRGEAARAILSSAPITRLIAEARADERQAAEADTVAKVVAWLRGCELARAIPDDPAQIVADLADALTQGAWK